MKKIVIIGNGAAGIAGAQAFRQNDKESTITIVTTEQYPYYYKPRLAEIIAGTVTQPQITVFKEEWYHTNGISVVYNAPVVSIDRSSKVVSTADASFSYDSLLIATGAQASKPVIPGVDLKHVFVLRSLHDALSIATFAQGKPRVVVIGGGLLALEAAYNLQKIGCVVTIVEVLSRLLPRQLDARAAQILQTHLEQLGFTFYIADQVESINGTAQVESVTLKNHGTINAEMVLISAGISPNNALAQQSGLSANRGIVVNASMQSDDLSVFAAGDCAELNGRIWGLWPVAMKQGAVAGAAMAGVMQKFVDPGNTTMLKITDIPVVSSGTIQDDSGTLESTTFEQGATYRNVLLDKGQMTGFVLLGNTSNYKQLSELLSKKNDVSTFKQQLPDPSFNQWPKALS